MPGADQNLPTREQIEERARQIHAGRGSPIGQEGDELADWLAAEKELENLLNAHDESAKNDSTDGRQNPWPKHMLLEYFGLLEQPFGMTPDPAYLFASRTHGEALAALSLGIAGNRGFFALIAEPGMGKTTLLYQLIEDMRESARAVLVSQTQCTSREFIEYILYDLGVDIKGLGLVAMNGKLNEILFAELLAGKRFVLVVDEAQNLDDSVLETVRMLSNFETHNTKLMQIILAGQPRLASKLAQPALSQLRQRIAVLSRLEPFTSEETRLYIEHRLKVAGFSGESIFDPAAIARIAQLTHGVPRNINNLCYNSLLLAYTRRQRLVTAAIVQEASDSLVLELLAPESLVAPNSFAAPVTNDSPAPALAPGSHIELLDPAATIAAVTMTVPVAVVSPVTMNAAAAPLAPISPTPALAAAKVSAPRPSASAATSPAANAAANAAAEKSIPTNRQPKSFLTYGGNPSRDSGKKINPRKWLSRSAVLAVALLSGTLLLAILGRSESRHILSPSIFHRSREIPTDPIPADRSQGSATPYAADPQDTGNGLVLTVMAGPQQTLKDLSIRYAGHYDDEIAAQIRSLNPDLKDPDHLEAGQLIRIPLPPGAIKKVNDTGEATTASKREGSEGLFSRFSALLRLRK